MSGTSSDGLLELVVIGAGPHALSLLTRLVDDEPDMLTERERVRIMQKAGSRGRSHTAVRKHLQKHFDGAAMLPGVAVIDAHGRWMAQWESNFDALAIPHTRSHADLHPCPFDFQSLRVFAEARKRQDELWHMQYIDREASRAAGYAGPYVLPGIKLFNDFCHSLVARYGLGGLVRRGTVERIQVLPSAAGGGDASDAPCTFELLLGDGTTLHARRVVCAMGPGPAFTGMRATLPWYDVDLELVGDRRAESLGAFWKLETARERLARIAQLRGGGSMSHEVYHGLLRHMAGARAEGGGGASGEPGGQEEEQEEGEPGADRFTLLEGVEVQEASWRAATEQRPAEVGVSEVGVSFDDGTARSFDYVWLATGGNLDLSLVPLLSSMQEQVPIETAGGLPLLQADLSWAADCPLYVMGAFAQLQLGADALNLAGARSGGVLVARRLLEARAAAKAAAA